MYKQKLSATQNFYLGCAVWAYDDWVGNLYPPNSRSQDFLSLYSRRFTAVEGNTTFYAVPSLATIARWRQETTPQFKFCPKFPKNITHRGLLQPQFSAAMSFVERMQKLGDRLGVLFIQLPPSYTPAYLEDLAAFLQGFQDLSFSFALEVRHLEWFEEPHASRLNELLSQLSIGRVLLDTRPIYNSFDDPQLNSTRRKPKVPLQPIVTSKFSLVRFISHPNSEYNQTYLREWVELVTRWLQQNKQVYFFVHCPFEARSPNTALSFQQLLEAKATNIPPLPWMQIPSTPQQLSLFDF